MGKILLIEPNYKNKYPPLGLMKISTFHKEYRKDYVKFIKGINKEEELEPLWDRIYITTLFTFDYKIVIETIEYYKKFVKNWKKDIIIGGILASLLPDKIFEATGIKPFKGQITSASQIGYEKWKETNIDILTLDYDILSEIEYEYSAGDNYFGYTSRGCLRKCPFCAVSELEPIFMTTNNIKNQIEDIDNKYGEKRNLLLMDNNILHSPNLKEIISDLNILGFKKGEKTYLKSIPYINIYNRIQRRKKFNIPEYNSEILKDIDKILVEFSNVIEKRPNIFLKSIIEDIINSDSLEEKYEILEEKNNQIIEILKQCFHRKKLERFVDFNQGTDARLLTEDKMAVLSKIAVKPYRIALDGVHLKDIYENAVRLAHSYGVKTFSNYILFNYEDTPEDFWDRLNFNINLSQELDLQDLFSFPMKFSPIQETDRKFIGRHWTKKKISNIYAILNAKKGIVPKKKEYFDIAFGKNIEEFKELLNYPRDFIIFRNYFKEIKFVEKWKKLFDSLNEIEKKEFEKIVDKKYNGKNEIIKKLINIEYINKNKTDYIQRLLFENKKIDNDTFFNITYEVAERRIISKKDIKIYIEKKGYINQIKKSLI